MTDVVSTSVRRKKWREYWKVKASHIQEGALFSLVSVWQISQEDFKDIIIQELTWKKFYVHLAGCTGGAHLHIVDLLKQLNQSEVSLQKKLTARGRCANRLPDLLLTVDCLFNEGKLLSSKHNKAAYMEIIKLIATSYQGYVNKFATEGS
ncbi:hypothetical protein D4764_19G0003090 [Takifugu flavidus]|uniref:Uncharacterized protein n=1 Tax=Takifugu flavidus TaxID=433684 RepID=A0A5C6NPI5_9TELE|nr:hypothetical protein D4764_19G0003090 [Takifugu flavidus]